MYYLNIFILFLLLFFFNACSQNFQKNGLSEKQLYKKVHRQVMKAIAQDRVDYTWTSRP